MLGAEMKVLVLSICSRELAVRELQALRMLVLQELEY
jgi:hypothetical protein